MNCQIYMTEKFGKKMTYQQMKLLVSIYELQLYAAHVTFQQLENSVDSSAHAAYHLCEKVANFDDRNQSNFGRFDDMSQWFVKRDADEIRNNAYIWKGCNTEDAQKIMSLRPLFVGQRYISFRTLTLQNSLSF